ncbi:MAG: hypothetical protein PHY34_02815 [Patescibacteria group bacterium]|nr:hypothetical protein [Patescibacteria group bacterium]MDD5715390.1 hypothetical protein [Patescibacteria group bacterium]
MRRLLGILIMAFGIWFAANIDPALHAKESKNKSFQVTKGALDPSEIPIATLIIEGVGVFLVFADGTVRKITPKK